MVFLGVLNNEGVIPAIRSLHVMSIEQHAQCDTVRPDTCTVEDIDVIRTVMINIHSINVDKSAWYASFGTFSIVVR